MAIVIVEYDASWPEQFARVAADLRVALGDKALSIHHIGSTSVPGLAAKDLIDVQITVARLDDEVRVPLTEAGFRFLDHIDRDHRPPGSAIPDSGLRKQIYVEPEGARRANIHVRLAGSFNQRYAVLFRDYVREHDAARDAYGRLKVNLATKFAEDPDAYYDIKDPAIDMLMSGAEVWARATGWDIPPSDA